MPGKNRTSRFVAVAIGVVVLYYGAIFAQSRQSLFSGASDFSCFYTAGKIVLSGQGNLVYGYKIQREAQADFLRNVSFRKGPLLYNHAPFELLVFVPLALLSYSHATIVWYCFNICGLLLVPWLLQTRLTFLKQQIPYAVLALAFFMPANIALLQGQDSVLLLLLFTLGFMQLAAGHDGRAGCIFALAMFKPQFVLLLLLVMVITRKWNLLRFFFGTCCALLAISAALVGWRTAIAFPRFLMEFSQLPPAVAGAYPDAMPNIRGLVYAVLNGDFSPGFVQAATLGFSTVLLLLVAIASSRYRHPISAVNFSLIVVGSLIASYHLNVHDLTLLILPIFLVADYVGAHGLSTARALLVMSAGLVFILPSLLPPPPITVAALLFFLALLLRESLRPEACGSFRLLAESERRFERTRRAILPVSG